MALRESFVETPFGRFHVEEAGAGPPVLFIHGGMASAREWRPILPALSAHARCIALDRLGCGLSDWSRGGYGRDYLTRSLLGLADGLGLSRFDVVGQSLGGVWALSLAFAAPERVNRLVLVNAAGGPSTPEDQAALRARVQRDPAAPELPVEEQIERTLRSIFADPGRAPAGFRDDLRWQMERADPAQWGEVPDLIDHMSDERFDRIACPTLVVWGEVDAVMPPAMGWQLAAAIPGARYVGLPDCGHTCQIECPDAFVTAVAPFLDQTA